MWGFNKDNETLTKKWRFIKKCEAIIKIRRLFENIFREIEAF
jgi:hypothetical protein